MQTNTGMEAWLSNSVPEIPILLQAATPALTQSIKEGTAYLEILKRHRKKTLKHQGRSDKKNCSSVLGLFFHATEHYQGHVGQLLVTLSVVKAEN